MYMGGKNNGINSDVFSYQKNPACRACQDVLRLRLAPSSSFKELVDLLQV
jgi:hypothetical protein